MTTAEKMLNKGYSKQELQKYIDEKEDAAVKHIKKYIQGYKKK